MRALIVVVLVLGSVAAERIDFFDKNSKRTGYATIDRKTGRVDIFNTQSKRTGFGTITKSKNR